MEGTQKIMICDKEYEMKASVLTIANYKNIFGMNEDFGDTYLLVCKTIKELKPLIDLNKKDEKELNEIEKQERELTNLKIISKLMSIIPSALKLAYAMIREVDNNFMPYDEWLSTLEGVGENPNWLYGVVGIASNVFRRKLSK